MECLGTHAVYRYENLVWKAAPCQAPVPPMHCIGRLDAGGVSSTDRETGGLDGTRNALSAVFAHVIRAVP